MKNPTAHFYKEMPDANFSVDIVEGYAHRQGISIGPHWHEHLQIYYLTQGRASLVCGNSRMEVGPGNLIVINSCEMHSTLESRSEDLRYFILRIDPSFLFSNQVDACQAKYISPLSQNLICFHNLIENDAQIIECVKTAIKEYKEEKVGYELEVKAAIYHLLVLLLRGYVDRILTQEEFDERAGRMKRLAPVFQFIEDNYADKITASGLARRANLSLSHFCRVFKQVSGKTVTDYVNDSRLEKAVSLLAEGEKNITEIALSCGFYDANYFSRVFKKHFRISPVAFRKSGSPEGSPM